jgi:hypothetical protein
MKYGSILGARVDSARGALRVGGGEGMHVCTYPDSGHSPNESAEAEGCVDKGR